MSTVVVTGTQWGDEGKGKIVDYLAQQADIVVRHQGGSNAGHTVVVDGQDYKLRLMPSGILYKGSLCIVGNGVAFDPKIMLEDRPLRHPHLEPRPCRAAVSLPDGRPRR